MTLDIQRARQVIWTPDHHSIENVAGAALCVLEYRGAGSLDRAQATYLITTMRPLWGGWEYAN